MKTVLLWIASIFSRLLDAVKKSKLDIITIQVPTYKLCDMNINFELKGEKTMKTIIIITSSIKNLKAYREVSEYASQHDMCVIGSYIEGAKRCFLLCGREG